VPKSFLHFSLAMNLQGTVSFFTRRDAPRLFGHAEHRYVHLLRLRYIELPRSQKPQHTKRVQPLCVPQLLQFSPELSDLLVLLLGCVAWVTGLRLGSGGGVVIVVVFGVEVCVGRILRRLRHGVHGFHGGRLVAMTVEMGRHGWDCGCWVELWEE
jgi:hypothetical protein